MVKLAPFMARILLVDDDQGVRESTARMLRSAGYTVQVASTGEDAFEAAKTGGFDVVLSDMRMPGLSGIDVLRKLREVRRRRVLHHHDRASALSRARSKR